jgi:hypothetical protein
MFSRFAACVFVVILLFAVPTGAAAQTGAKALFYDALKGGRESFGSVGIRVWFDVNGTSTTKVAATSAGAHPRLHVRANSGGYLMVWVVDTIGNETQLTRAAGRYPGYRLSQQEEFIASVDVGFAPSDSEKQVIVLFTRSQTEQVRTVLQALTNIGRISGAIAPDGQPLVVQEIDSSAPDEIGIYVVHRSGGEPGVAITIGR